MPSNTKNTVTCCMILKNEGQTILSALRSISAVDEFVIGIDESTTDNTLEEVGKFAFEHIVNCYFFKWDDDFSKARNEGIDKAKGEYVFILDGHETVENYIPPIGHDTYYVNVRMHSNGYRVLHEQPRLFKKRHYFNKSHNQIEVASAWKLQTIVNHKRSESLTKTRLLQRKEMNFSDLFSRIKNGDERSKLQLAHEYMAFQMWPEAIEWFKDYKPRNEQEQYQIYINIGLCYYWTGVTGSNRAMAEKYFKMCDGDRNAHLVFLAALTKDVSYAKKALEVPKPEQFYYLYEDFYYSTPLRLVKKYDTCTSIIKS